MNPHQKLKTWGANKSVRLRSFDYTQHAPYHVTIRARAGTQPFVARPLAEMTCHILTSLFDERDAYLGAYCLMSNHLHVLMSPDRSGMSVGQLIAWLKGRTTKESWSFGASGKLWQPRYFDHIVRQSEDIAAVARYIYENPDRKGFARDYPYRWVDPALAS